MFLHPEMKLAAFNLSHTHTHTQSYITQCVCEICRVFHISSFGLLPVCVHLRN